MTRVFPFLRPPNDVVIVGPWSRLTPDGGELLADTLTDWDYSTTLSLHRPMTVDGLRLRRLSGFPEDAAIDLSVQWLATSSALRGRAWRSEVPADDRSELTIDFTLHGDDLGGTLELVTSITLRRSAPGSSVAAATRPGSMLWSDRQRVLLEGDNSLFPIATADFHDLPYPTGAGWYLHIEEDLEAAALGSILLVVNERHDVVMRAIESASSPKEADMRVLSTLRADVLRVLVERALTSEDLTEQSDYAVGSLGALLVSVVRNAFPAFSMEALRRERQTAPALFSSRIQEKSQLLVGP
jgi:NADPH-dependent ferric siderophore reductase